MEAWPHRRRWESASAKGALVAAIILIIGSLIRFGLSLAVIWRARSGEVALAASQHDPGAFAGIDRTALSLSLLSAGGGFLVAALVYYLYRETARRRLNEEALSAERQKLECAVAELERSRRHLAAAQRTARTGSWALDLRTDEIEWSDELYRLLGFDKAAGTPDVGAVRRGVHPDDLPAWEAQRLAVRGGERTGPYEFHYRRPSGVQTVLRWESELFCDEAGVPALQINTLCDVTAARAAERREMELQRQLQHSQKLEALGTLAGGIAHDLNNTLVPVLALSRMAHASLPASSPARDDLETVVEAALRAQDLVQRILAFSRKGELRRQAVDLSALVRNTLRMARAGVAPHIAIDCKLEPVPPLQGDPGQLQQVIVNLLTNAAQAIGDATGKIAIAVSSGDGQVEMRIADDGCGMDEATLARIFEPFFTTKRVGEGTGLGLSVVHGIVASHGGSIAVKSRPGEGSEFTIRLPTSPDSGDPLARSWNETQGSEAHFLATAAGGPYVAPQ
jgi:signal transduction histidine kinase